MIEKWKIENFKKDHPNVEFPACRQISQIECSNVQKKIRSYLGVSEDVNGLDLIKRVSYSFAFTYIDQIGSESGKNIEDVFRGINIDFTKTIWIDFYQFDAIYEFQLYELNRWFEYIVYQGADDVFLFDPHVSWIIHIDESYYVYWTKFELSPVNI